MGYILPAHIRARPVGIEGQTVHAQAQGQKTLYRILDAQSVIFPNNARVIAVLFPQQVGSSSMVCSAKSLNTCNTHPRQLLYPKKLHKNNGNHRHTTTETKSKLYYIPAYVNYVTPN